MQGKLGKAKLTAQALDCDKLGEEQEYLGKIVGFKEGTMGSQTPVNIAISEIQYTKLDKRIIGFLDRGILLMPCVILKNSTHHLILSLMSSMEIQ